MIRATGAWVVTTALVVMGVDGAVEQVAQDVAIERPAPMTPSEVDEQLRERRGRPASTTDAPTDAEPGSTPPTATTPSETGPPAGTPPPATAPVAPGGPGGQQHGTRPTGTDGTTGAAHGTDAADPPTTSDRTEGRQRP